VTVLHLDRMRVRHGAADCARGRLRFVGRESGREKATASPSLLKQKGPQGANRSSGDALPRATGEVDALIEGSCVLER
jgi:hypothetical protein